MFAKFGHPCTPEVEVIGWEVDNAVTFVSVDVTSNRTLGRSFSNVCVTPGDRSYVLWNCNPESLTPRL